MRRYRRHGIELAPGALIVDVGGNIGMFSRWAIHECAGDAHILAFEPVPELARALEYNLALAKLEQPRAGFTVLNCALSDVEGEAQFTFYPQCTMWSSAHTDMTDPAMLSSALDLVTQNMPSDSSQGGAGLSRDLLGADLVAEIRTVELRRLSSILHEGILDGAGTVSRDQPIALLKVDVEGAELEVLLGVDDTDWARVQQVAVEVHDRDGKLEAVTDLLVFHGFAVKVERGPPPFFLVQRHSDSVAADGSGLQFESSEMAHVFATRPQARV